jgi:hypothetical protein
MSQRTPADQLWAYYIRGFDGLFTMIGAQLVAGLPPTDILLRGLRGVRERLDRMIGEVEERCQKTRSESSPSAGAS